MNTNFLSLAKVAAQHYIIITFVLQSRNITQIQPVFNFH